MPVFADALEMEDHNLGGSHYGFSACRLDDLGASEYTLVAIAVDRSGSVSGFHVQIEACLKAILQACLRSPRADNLLSRVLVFDDRLDEVHGFRPLASCNAADYDGCAHPGGMTALHDAAINAVDSVAAYAKALVASDFSANGIVFVITDGEHNASALTAREVGRAKEAAIRGESLESLLTILVGVNVQGGSALSHFLQSLQADGEFDQYVELGDASPARLAKLAAFVSQSISSQSQSLGTGGPSQVVDPGGLVI